MNIPPPPKVLRFGDDLLDHHVSFIFGHGIFALRGVVISLEEDYLVVREEKDKTIIHVPFTSIVYAKLGVKVEA